MKPRSTALTTLLCILLASASPAVWAADAPARVRLTTSVGAIDIELDAERAPQSVANFLDLVDSGFYDGLIFHRVVANFMIQAGGYDSQMNYREPPRKVPSESANGLKNRRGTVAMARLDDPDSASTQFFINVKDNTHLDRDGANAGYTVFGKVISDPTVLTEIELVETHIAADMAAVPITPIVILKAERIN